MVQTAIQADKIKYPKIKYQFSAEIEFGMPSKECKNFGICRINPLRRGPAESSKGNLAVVTLLETGDVEMAFLRDSLRPNSYEKFLAAEHFLVEEDYYFHSAENEAYNFTIKKGWHTIQERASLVMVNFEAP